MFKALIETLTAPKGDVKAIAAVEATGALVLPVSKGSNLLMVDFRGVADKTNDVTLKKLLPLKQQVAWLNLAGSTVTDSGMATLAGFTNLNQLHIEKTAVGDSGVTKLKASANLEYLNVYQTQVSDKGLGSLKGMKNLKRLFVWGSKVTADGAKKFAAENKVYVNNG